MSDEINRTLGKIEGILVEFKNNTERRFDEITEASRLATEAAKSAQERADEAHAFAKLLVQKAGFMGGMVSCILIGIIWVFEHVPKALAAIAGAH